jgi:wyosine [tRNA(Phe)-imidazoG37] synthetase (radical SAM superfamily)
MYCEILSSLYLRANGEIPCFDDAGSNLALASIGENERFYPSKVFGNPLYTHIRESLTADRAPWTDVCNKCAMLRPHEPFQDRISEKHIKVFQVETTLACALACLGCTQKLELKTRRKPFKLTPETFDAMLTGLLHEGYRIDVIEYCGNGEPLNHPQFSDFVRAGRRRYPFTKQRLITNGNFSYEKAIGNVHLDQIIVSLDGAFQESYEQYRVNGNIAKVLQFMRDIPKEVSGYRQTLIWKYILFEFNDSDIEIAEAQRLRAELNFDQILFVVTHSENASMRFDANNICSLAIANSRTTVDCTPVHGISQTQLLRVDGRSIVRAEDDRTLMMIDQVVLLPNSVFNLRGWAISGSEIKEAAVWHNGEFVSDAKLGQFRLDVQDAFPGTAGLHSGYVASWNVKDGSEQSHDIRVEFTMKDGSTASYSGSFMLPDSC